MKKVIFLIVAILFALVGKEGYSQILYVPSGTGGIGSSTITGNIGIGTSSPSQKLEVVGNIKMNSFTTISGSSSLFNNDQITRLTLNINVPTHALIYYYNQSTSTFKMLSLGSSDPVSCLNIIPGGKVGIGTITPGGKLSFGNYRVNSNLPISSDQASHIRLYESGSVYYGLGVSIGALNIAANESGGTLRFYTNSIERIRIDGNGNVGIGTATPYNKLDVNGDINISPGSSFKVGGVPISSAINSWQTNSTSLFYNTLPNVGIGTSSPTGTLTVYKSESPLFEVSNSLQKLQITVANNAWDGAIGSNPGDVVIRPYALQETDHNGLISYIPNELNDGNSYIKFGDAKNGLWVGIFNNRVFRVDGLFVASEINVKVNVWNDYVFSKSYKLPTLKSVEAFINANGHLPEVPSEKQVKEHGVNVSEINATLLKKIEEITLYVIELNKKVEKLEEQNVVLKNKINNL